MIRDKIHKPRWDISALRAAADQWLEEKIAQKRAWKDLSPWWPFIHDWPKKIDKWLEDFVAGRYRFSPLKQYHFSDDVVTLWNCEDKLILFLLHQIIKPLFKYLLSPYCFSAQGISGVKAALNTLTSAFKKRNFKYVIRLDIKSYYASINHKILLQQLDASFDDERLLNYLHKIVIIPVDKHAELFSPTEGIPRRSSLSPFFGALYLKPLDQAFENRKGIFYARYMDDVVILFEKKGQFVRAKKRVKEELAKLKLKMSPHKTKIGKFDTFHFLGVNFTAPGHQPETRDEQQDPDQQKATQSATQHYEAPTTEIGGLDERREEEIEGSNTEAGNSTQNNQQILNICSAPRAPIPEAEGRQIESAETYPAATRIVDGKTQVTIRLHPRSCRRAWDHARNKSHKWRSVLHQI